MIINHPLLGPRDSAEFTYMGDARLIDRQLHSLRQILGDLAQFHRKQVSGAARQNAHGDIASTQTLRHLHLGAMAAVGEDKISTSCDRITCESFYIATRSGD